MGTNYYIICKCCGSQVHHVGKQSAGHPFCSNWTKEDVIEWLRNPNFELRNEYGEVKEWGWLKDRDWELMKVDNTLEEEFRWS